MCLINSFIYSFCCFCLEIDELKIRRYLKYEIFLRITAPQTALNFNEVFYSLPILLHRRYYQIGLHNFHLVTLTSQVGSAVEQIPRGIMKNWNQHQIRYMSKYPSIIFVFGVRKHTILTHLTKIANVKNWINGFNMKEKNGSLHYTTFLSQKLTILE